MRTIKKLIRILKNLSYGGQTKVFFREQRSRIALQNCALMRKFCFAISVILSIVLISSFFLDYLKSRSAIFFVFICFFAVLGLIMLMMPKRDLAAAGRLFYFYIFVIFFFGFIVGVTFDNGYDGIIFNILTLLVPVVFTLPLHSVAFFLLPTHLLYYSFCILCLPHFDAVVSIIHASICLLSSFFIHAVVLSSRVYVLAVNEQLRMMCEIDELTGLPNRRSFNHFITSAYNANSNLTLVIADIDNFKDYNDIYGHLVGDDVLTNVASVLAKFADDNGIFVARYGGEEFVLVDNRHNPADFIKLIHELIQNVYELNIENHYSPVGRISLSAGIANKFGTATCDDLLEKADKALYKAKSAGKNCVVGDVI